jgi:hypothetical protein
MTTPVLHSLLAVYGAFDQVATQTQNPEVRAKVEQLLPGTTGKDQIGWYDQIKRFVRQQRNPNAPLPENDEIFPPVDRALQGFMDLGTTAEGGPPELDARAIGRLFHATIKLAQLKEFQDSKPNPVPFLQQLDPQMLAGVVALATNFPTLNIRSQGTAPESSASPDPSSSSQPATEPPGGVDAGDDAEAADDDLEALPPGGAEPENLAAPDDPKANQLRTNLHGIVDADELNDRLQADADSAAPLLPPELAAMPEIVAVGTSVGPRVLIDRTRGDGTTYKEANQGTVTGAVIETDDVLCALLTTKFERTPYDPAKVASVLDPLNWDNANKFFADMTSMGPGPDGRSSQVLEEVSTDPDLYRIKTALKYVKEERPRNTYVINYDFADNRGAQDSQQVRVDSGYIVVSPTADEKGVQVLTSKMVAIDGLSPTAVAIYAHAMGWLAIGEMMMFGDPVALPDDDIVPWSTLPNPVASTFQVHPGSQASRQGSQATAVPPAPQPVSRILVKETTKAVADYIDVASSETLAIADKWFNGELSVDDVVKHTRKLGGRLASEPFKILETMIKNVAGRPSDGSPTNQTRGSGQA